MLGAVSSIYEIHGPGGSKIRSAVFYNMPPYNLVETYIPEELAASSFREKVRSR
jgi:hypothetical protein